MDSPRKSNTQISRVLEYFDPILIEGQHKITHYTCKLCNNVLCAKKNTNLTNHLNTESHKTVFSTKIKKNNLADSLQIKRLKFMQYLVELVTINKEPFTLLSKSGFLNIVEDKLREFNEAGIGIDLYNKNCVEVKNHLNDTANKMRQKIKNEVMDKTFSLSADIVTKNNRSIFGVFMQYIHDGEHKIRCIGMRELTQPHTGKYLCTEINKCTEEFGFKKNQVITITTDNGSNMKTLVKSMNENLEIDTDVNAPAIISNEKSNDSDLICNTENHELYDNEIDEVLNRLDDEDENEVDQLMYGDFDENEEENDWEFQNYSIDVDLAENMETQLFFVNRINCGAHTVQLAVKDALKLLNKTHKNVISLAKVVVIFIRRQNTRNEIRNRGLNVKLPVIDNDTRWSSTYMMVSQFNYSYNKYEVFTSIQIVVFICNFSYEIF